MKLQNRLLPCFVAALLCTMSFSAAAAETTAPESTALCPEPISPAIRVLAARRTLTKNTVAAWSQTEGEPSPVSFSEKDFAEVLGYTPTEVVIASLPDRSVGTLRLGTLEVAVGSALSPSAMAHLQFVPSGTASAEQEEHAAPRSTSFTFTARGKVYRTDTPLACFVYLLDEENTAPTAADLCGVTYTEIPLHGTLCGADPDADTLSYEIVRMPKKGNVAWDAARGTFVYTPMAGKRGRDVFTYRVTDPWGNQSEVCRVEVEIRRADEQFCYADLADTDCIAAAMYLADEGIMTGTTLGSAPVFSPEENVTRGAFLVMAMNAAGLTAAAADESTVTQTMTFADEENTSAYLQPYLALAKERGILSGAADETGTCSFAPDAVITAAEAAVIVSRLFVSPEEADAVAVYAEQMAEAAVPAWSASAYSALDARGIPINKTAPGDAVTRGDAAVMLAAAMWGEKQ